MKLPEFQLREFGGIWGNEGGARGKMREIKRNKPHLEPFSSVALCSAPRKTRVDRSR